MMERVKKAMEEIAESSFNGGVIVCLSVLHAFDEPTIAQEIVSANGGIKQIEKHVSDCNKIDIDMLAWLKSYSVK